MKNIARPRDFGWIALAALALAMFSSSSFRECVCSTQASYYEKDGNASIFSVVAFLVNITRLNCAGDFIYDKREAILAAFTILLAFFTLSLWSSTKELAQGAEAASVKTLNHLEDTSKKELRAYVAVRGGHIERVPGMGLLRYRAYIQVANFGRTPAKKVIKAVDWELLPLPLDKGREFRHTNAPGNWVIAPFTGAHPYWTFIEEFDLTSPQVAALDEPDPEKRTMAIFFWGRASYQDMFNCKHELQFRYRSGDRRIVPDRNGIPTGDGWILDPEQNGNSTT